MAVSYNLKSIETLVDISLMSHPEAERTVAAEIHLIANIIFRAERSIAFLKRKDTDVSQPPTLRSRPNTFGGC